MKEHKKKYKKKKKYKRLKINKKRKKVMKGKLYGQSKIFSNPPNKAHQNKLNRAENRYLRKNNFRRNMHAVYQHNNTATY